MLSEFAIKTENCDWPKAQKKQTMSPFPIFGAAFMS